MKLRLSIFAVLAAIVSASPSHAQWIANGDSLCTSNNEQSVCVAASDGLGGAIVAWRDRRTTGNGLDLYAQGISGLGSQKWAMNGVSLCTASGDQDNVSLCQDAVGGAIAAWEDYRKSIASPGIWAQRVRFNGVRAWASNGVPLDTTAGYQVKPLVVPDGHGGAIVAWEATRNNVLQIYAQRVDSTGTPLWAVNGIAVSANASDQMSPTLIADGEGGAFLAWYDSRETSEIYSAIYMQRITSAGVPHASWPAAGLEVCDASEFPGPPTLAVDDSGGAVVVWDDQRNYGATGTDIYAQRVGPGGELRWATDGVPVCTATGNQEQPRPVSDGAGGAIVAWQDARAGIPNTTLYVQRLQAQDGAREWSPPDGVLLCTASGRRTGLDLISDDAGGAVGAWQDYRSGLATDIYAQRIDGSGARIWPDLGAAICVAANDQQLPALASDFSGGAIVAWHDNRKGSSTSNYDAYAQRVTSAGQVAPTLGVSFRPTLAIRLGPPRPNPARAAVVMTLELPEPMSVEAVVFDLAGRRVQDLMRGERLGEGPHGLSWDGRDATGSPTAPGLYFVRVRAGGAEAHAKVVRAR